MNSVQSNEPCYVFFENCTGRTINVIWLGYKGTEQPRFVLQPYAVAKMNTFRSHPWIFRDKYTSERMHCMHHRIFLPIPLYRRNPQSPENVMPARLRACIHFPVRSLRESCLWQVMKNLRALAQHESITHNDINNLDIPLTLKKDLHLILNTMVYFRDKNAHIRPLNL